MVVHAGQHHPAGEQSAQAATLPFPFGGKMGAAEGLQAAVAELGGAGWASVADRCCTQVYKSDQNDGIFRDRMRDLELYAKANKLPAVGLATTMN